MPEWMNKAEEKLWNEAKKIVSKQYKKKDDKFWGTVQKIYQAKKKKHLDKGKKKKRKKKMKKSDLYNALVKQANFYMTTGDISSFDRLIPMMRRLAVGPVEVYPEEQLKSMTAPELALYYENLSSRYFQYDEQLDNLQTEMESGRSRNPGETADRIRLLEERLQQIEDARQAAMERYQVMTGGERYVSPEAAPQVITPLVEEEKERPARKRKPSAPPPPKEEKASAEELADAAAVRELANPEDKSPELSEEILKRIFISARRGVGQTTEGAMRALGRNMIGYLQSKMTGGDPTDDLTAGLSELEFTDERGNRMSAQAMNRRLQASLDAIDGLITQHVTSIEDRANDFWRRASAMKEAPIEEVMAYAQEADQELVSMLRKAGQRITGVVRRFQPLITGRTGQMGVERVGPTAVRRRRVDPTEVPHERLPREYQEEIAGPVKGRKGRGIQPIPLEGRPATPEEIEEEKALEQARRETLPRQTKEELRGRRTTPFGRTVVRRRREPGEERPERAERPMLELPEEGPMTIRRTRLPKRRK